MITPAYVRTVAAYNAETNRRLYAAAARLPNAERRVSRCAFWVRSMAASKILWGDQQWMSRSDGWPNPATRSKKAPI